MKRILSLSLFVSLMVAGVGAVAAQPSTQPSAAATAGASAEVKAGTGVENKESVGAASEFTGPIKIWVWSRITGAAGTSVTHVWKLNGQKNWQAKLKVGSKKWTTSSRRQVKAGSWTVEVVAADGSVLGSTDFTVK